VNEKTGTDKTIEEIDNKRFDDPVVKNSGIAEGIKIKNTDTTERFRIAFKDMDKTTSTAHIDIDDEIELDRENDYWIASVKVKKDFKENSLISLFSDKRKKVLNYNQDEGLWEILRRNEDALLKLRLFFSCYQLSAEDGEYLNNTTYREMEVMPTIVNLCPFLSGRDGAVPSQLASIDDFEIKIKNSLPYYERVKKILADGDARTKRQMSISLINYQDAKEGLDTKWGIIKLMISLEALFQERPTPKASEYLKECFRVFTDETQIRLDYDSDDGTNFFEHMHYLRHKILHGNIVFTMHGGGVERDKRQLADVCKAFIKNMIVKLDSESNIQKIWNETKLKIESDQESPDKQ